MRTKTLSIIAYLTLIGWLISYFSNKDRPEDFISYHLNQGLGLLVFSVLLSLALSLIISITGLAIIGYVGILPFLLMIIGMINAANEVKKPLPVIGHYFQNKFIFIR
ncbi:MAG TPA: DUF4870 domain-containing protein [Candidatus Sphingobacterium stercorigallinarum]|nr:DUF4870 domain-containing protein [Candidatus Sphingobacterium stercorigallinarum]